MQPLLRRSVATVSTVTVSAFVLRKDEATVLSASLVEMASSCVALVGGVVGLEVVGWRWWGWRWRSWRQWCVCAHSCERRTATEAVASLGMLTVNLTMTLAAVAVASTASRGTDTSSATWDT